MTNFKIVEANPGYYALDRLCWKNQDKIEITKIPVIAWRIRVDGENSEVYPICVDGLSDLWEDEILTPDGSVYRRHYSSWRSLEEFEAEINKKVCPRANHIETTIMNKLAEAGV